MDFSPSGRMTFERLVQFRKVKCGIVSIPLDTVSRSSFVHSSNARSPKDTTDAGILMIEMAAQW